MLEISSAKESLVLDFFSGSVITATPLCNSTLKTEVAEDTSGFNFLKKHLKIAKRKKQATPLFPRNSKRANPSCRSKNQS